MQVVRQLAPGATPQSLAGAEAEAFQLYDAVTALLVDASREQPVVVVLEDLHWADTASLRLLEFVVRHAWFERLLVIGTYRDAEVDGPLSLPLEAKATTLTLAGLDLGGVERLVALTTGWPRRPGWSPRSISARAATRSSWSRRHACGRAAARSPRSRREWARRSGGGCRGWRAACWTRCGWRRCWGASSPRKAWSGP
ncbi:AAA family ATPase [Nonomuraea thailandensis]